MVKKILSFCALIILVSCSSTQDLKEKSPNEKRAEIFYSHGTSLLMHKDYTGALDNLLKALDLDPRNSKIHNNLGMAYYFKNDVEKAITHLKRAITLDEKNSDARNNIASIYFSRGELAMAEEQYRLVEKDLIYRNQYRTYYNLALIELKRNRVVQAMDFLRKSVADKDDYCPANYQLGLLEKQRYNNKAALQWFRDAQKGVCVSDPLPHYQEALTLIELKENEGAIEKFTYVIDKFPTTKYAPLAQNQIRNMNNTENKSIIERQALKRKFEKSRLNEENPTYSTPKF